MQPTRLHVQRIGRRAALNLGRLRQALEDEPDRHVRVHHLLDRVLDLDLLAPLREGREVDIQRGRASTWCRRMAEQRRCRWKAVGGSARREERSEGRHRHGSLKRAEVKIVIDLPFWAFRLRGENR